MKIEWHFRYVPEGQMEPDKQDRWAIDGFIHVHVKKGLPEKWHWLPFGFKKNYHPVKVCVISQSGTRGTPKGAFRKGAFRFTCDVPYLMDPQAGFSVTRCLYSNDLEDLKRQIEQRFEEIRMGFLHCLNK
jgi:hypothetical protein